MPLTVLPSRLTLINFNPVNTPAASLQMALAPCHASTKTKRGPARPGLQQY